MQSLSQRLTADPRAALPLSLWAGLLLMDGIFWSRGFAGALSVALPAPLALGTSLIISALSVWALICWRESARDWFPQAPWWPEMTTLLVPLFWGIAAGVGTTPFTWGGLAATWGMLIVAVGLVHVWCPAETGELASEISTDDPTADPAIAQSPALNSQPSTLNHPLDWQKRLVLDGRELIEGEARVHFAAGQKEAMLHLSFCPPFAAVPDVQGEDALGGEVEIRAEAMHTFGARLSVRRTAGIESAESRQISYIAMPAEMNNAAA